MEGSVPKAGIVDLALGIANYRIGRCDPKLRFHLCRFAFYFYGFLDTKHFPTETNHFEEENSRLLLSATSKHSP